MRTAELDQGQVFQRAEISRGWVFNREWGMQNAGAGGDTAIVLDFDGVIIKSHVAKRKAMLAMFAGYPDKSEEIDAFIRSSGGVARREKLAAILETIMGIEATPARLAQYLGHYARSLETSLAAAPLVDGVKNFLSHGAGPFYISSTAPEAEIHGQLVRSDLLHCFTAVYGSRTPKARALAEISAQHADTKQIVFFGDSPGDLVAAQEAGVAFVGVTNERDNFKDLDVVKLGSFDSRDRVQHAMQAALIRLDTDLVHLRRCEW